MGVLTAELGVGGGKSQGASAGGCLVASLLLLSDLLGMMCGCHIELH